MGTANHNFIGRVRIGKTVPALPAGEDMIVRIVGEDAANPQHLSLEYYNGSSNAPTQDFRKARGTADAPADAQIGDRVIDIRGVARSTTFQFGSAFRSYIDGPGPLVAGQNPPTRLGLQVNLQNAASREVVFVSSDGFVGISNGLFSTTERPAAHVHILGEAGDVHMHIEKVSADADPPLFEGFKARGTVAARANAALNDATLRLAGFARATTYFDGAKIEFLVDAAVVAGQAPASRIEFSTNANNAAKVLYSKLNSQGLWRHGPGFCALATTEALVQPQDGHVIASDSGENANHLNQIRASASASGGPSHVFRRMRDSFAGAISTPTNANVQNGDQILRIEGAAWSGATGWWTGARVDCQVDGAVTDNQRPGMMWRIYTNASNAAAVERYRMHGSGIHNLAPAAAATAGGSTTNALTFGTSPGVLGVYFGSGAPTLAAGKGSLYLRTDGSATNNRAYINTDGGTTWTAITTVA